MKHDGTQIRVLNKDGHASHYTWRNDAELLHYTTQENRGTGYYLYNELDKSAVMIGEGVLREDGHPTFLADKRRLITDTYPDKYGDQKVLLYDIDLNNCIELGKFYLPPNFAGETRCDLHPRLDRAQRWMAVDVVRKGRRGVQLIRVPAGNDIKGI